MTKTRWPVAGLDCQAPVSLNARLILRVRIAEYYHFEPIVEDEQAIEELHQLRIAAKRLRYTLELFADYLGAETDRQIMRVRQIQESLGTLHDCDVRISIIEAELVALSAEQIHELNHRLAIEPEELHRSLTAAALRPPPDDPRRGLIALLSRQHAARRAAYAEFHHYWKLFASEGMRSDLVRLSRRSG